MKCTLTLLLICISCKCFSQHNQDIDTLRKYSYCTEGYYRPKSFDDNGVSINNEKGTSFFIKKSNRVFQITAKHVLCGFDSIGTNIISTNNTYNQVLITYLNDSGTLLNSGFFIDVKKIRDTSVMYYNQTFPDLIVNEMFGESKKDSINSLEQFDNAEFNQGDTVEIIIWGYPEWAFSGCLTSTKDPDYIFVIKPSVIKRQIENIFTNK